MNSFLSSTLTAALLLSLASAPAAILPKGDTYVPGNKPQESLPAAEYKGALLPAMLDYHFCLRQQHRLDTSSSDVRHARACVIDAARRHPEEVNDLLQRTDGSWATPLSLAVQAQDAELVEMLLSLGALPFTPRATERLEDLPLLPSATPNAEIARLLHHARSYHNPLRIMLDKRLTHLKEAPGAVYPQEGTSTLHQLRRIHENTYMAAPGKEATSDLYCAFRNFRHPDASLLRVQPISRTVVSPVEGEKGYKGHYGSISTTARVVNALKGEVPEQELLSWTVPIEGRPRKEGTYELGADAEPVFLHVSTEQLKNATVENKVLKLHHLEGFELCTGEKWQAVYDRILDDYPELLETTPATPEERAAAVAVLEESPCLVRATIIRRHARLDEASGQVQVTYHARLRDPLRGALIKGHLRDWQGVEYQRRFPLTEEWKQYLAAHPGRGGQACEVPVILALAEAAEGEESIWPVQLKPRCPMKLLRAIDTRNDPALFRAINEAALFPWE